MGDAGRAIYLSNPEWLEEYRQLLTDLSDDDVCKSCFAITLPYNNLVGKTYHLKDLMNSIYFLKI